MDKNFKSGFVSIIGRPNVGKSTLLNQILKQKVVIVTPKAQTTRNKIQGIHTTAQEQIIFIDTPGIHKAKNELGTVMNQYAMSSLDGIDVVLFMVDVSEPLGEGDKYILEQFTKNRLPVVLVANKVDKVKSQEELDANITTYKEAYPFKAGIAISASGNYQVEELMKIISDLLPIGPMYYPEDQLLDQPEKFVVAEIIREKVLMKTEEEVPHSVAVTVDSFKPSKTYKGMIEIHATIIVERSSQKKIIIGAGGKMIKDIGTLARKDIVNFLGNKIYLELFVKVEDNWRNSPGRLKEYGYSINKE